jgi:chromosome segregation ATPase
MEDLLTSADQPTVPQLQTENEQLRQELTEYRELTALHSQTIRELGGQAAAGTVIRSYYDLQNNELQHLREYIRELLQRAEAAADRETELEKQVSVSVRSSWQLDDIRSQYNHLQAQLNDLQERLQELHRQQTAVQQQAARVSELESQLAIAEEEIELLKLRQTSENDE